MGKIYLLEVPPDNKELLKSVVHQLAREGSHPVLKEAALYQFWGATTLVLMNEGLALSINQTKIGKRKKNKWEPYANWYGAFTVPSARRKGHAYRLYVEMEKRAVDAGCRRIKSLAGSSAGLGLHRSLRHLAWGPTPKGEVWIDSPLPGSETLYSLTERPPQAPGEMMSAAEVERAIQDGLRYDNRR